MPNLDDYSNLVDVAPHSESYPKPNSLFIPGMSEEDLNPPIRMKQFITVYYSKTHIFGDIKHTFSTINGNKWRITYNWAKTAHTIYLNDKKWGEICQRKCILKSWWSVRKYRETKHKKSWSIFKKKKKPLKIEWFLCTGYPDCEVTILSSGKLCKSGDIYVGKATELSLSQRKKNELSQKDILCFNIRDVINESIPSYTHDTTIKRKTIFIEEIGDKTIKQELAFVLWYVYHLRA